MKAKVLSIVVVAALMAWPAAASACVTYHGFTFMGVPAGSFGVNAGLNFEIGSDGGAHYLIPSVDAAIPLGEIAVVRPTLGWCKATGGDEGADDDSEIIFGGAAGVNVLSNDMMTLNLQGGLTYVSYEGGSEMTFPITAAAMFGEADATSFYGGAGLQVNRWSPDEGDSESESDPVIFAGVNLGAMGVPMSIGGEMKIGEDHDGDTSMDFSINFNVALPVGG